jgi:probable rRNA maturation factor
MHINLYNDTPEKMKISVVVITHLLYHMLEQLQHHCFLTLNIYLCTPEQMRQFNATFRGIDLTTDILSFAPNNDLALLTMYHLGDLVIVPSILAEYSAAHHISLERHWYHIIIHGVLHLLGYDHVEQEEALIMEALEQLILQQFILKVAAQDFWLSS